MKAVCVTKETASPSAQDGYHGARDAALLGCYDYDPELGVCHVQVIRSNRELIRRAGITGKLRQHTFCAVPVVVDRFGRRQLATKAGGAK